METLMADRVTAARVAAPVEASVSAVSWPAIFAGAFAAVAVSVIFLALGSGLGLGIVSPWSGSGVSAATFTAVTAIWLIVVQWVASGLGGYLTGRLRTKWANVHTHEVFFRDTAHGFVTWALATIVSVVVVASATTFLASAGARAVGSVGSGAAQAVATTAGSSVTPYDVDSLFRSAAPDANAPSSDAKGEATRILARSLTTGELAAEDRAYLARLMAARTGMSEQEAAQRLDRTEAQIKAADAKARAAADAARKAAALASLYVALSLLIGAFIASVAAALGGRQRDEQIAVA
jgi:hypothetical protein